MKEVVSLKDSLELVTNLTKDFYYVIDLGKIEEFENDLVFVNLFQDEYILAHRTEKLFFGYFTSRYGLFKLTDIKDVLNTAFTDDTPLGITRYFSRLNGDKLMYVNSYGGYFKETLIYKPLLFNFSKKHTKGNIVKRNLYEIVKIMEENADVVSEFRNTEVSEVELKEIFEEFGPRVIKKTLNIDISEREMNYEILSPYVNTFGDAIDLIIKFVDTNPDSSTIMRDLTNISVKLTNRLVDKYKFFKMF